MRKHKRIWLILAIIAVAASSSLLIWWLTRPRLSDEEQIELAVADLVRAAEAKNAKDIISYISKEYEDSEGMNYARVRYLCNRMLRSHETVNVNILDFNGPSVSGDSAEIDLLLDVRVVDRSTPVAKVQGEITLYFQREGNKWRIVRAQGWQQWVVGIGPY